MSAEVIEMLREGLAQCTAQVVKLQDALYEHERKTEEEHRKMRQQMHEFRITLKTVVWYTAGASLVAGWLLREFVPRIFGGG